MVAGSSPAEGKKHNTYGTIWLVRRYFEHRRLLVRIQLCVKFHRSLMVRIAGFHPADPGSIPGDEGNRLGKTLNSGPRARTRGTELLNGGMGLSAVDCTISE